MRHYWKSGSSVPSIPERGYQLVQRIVPGDVVAGIAIDRNVTKHELIRRDGAMADARRWPAAEWSRRR